MNELDMAVVAARCYRSKALFGMSFKKTKEEEWHLYWAFLLKETSAQREGYDRTQISGQLITDPQYPGCPHCSSKPYYRCGTCGRVSCWDGIIRTVTCPWCGAVGPLSGTLTSLDAGQDT